MMSVFEYAEDVNVSVEEILRKCKMLHINVNTKDDMLDDEAITLLDNEVMNQVENSEEMEQLNEELIEDIAEEITFNNKIDADKKENSTSKV